MLKVAGPEGTVVGRWSKRGLRSARKEEKIKENKDHLGKRSPLLTYISQVPSMPYDRAVLQPTVRPLYRSYQPQGNLYSGFVHPKMVHVAPYLLV
jgi:hypothetical protein